MKKYGNFFACICIFLLTYPLFFDIFRFSIFDIISHDDYASYLLYFLGKEGGRLLDSPFTYRFFSVLVAIPFYYLPTYTFSKLNGVSYQYIKANQALAFLSYIAIIGTLIMIYKITKNRLKASPLIAVLASLLSFLLFNFTSKIGVDTLAIFVISILIYIIDYKYVFMFLILLSTWINEKILIVFFFYLLGRVLLNKDKTYIVQFISSCGAICLYLITIKLFPTPGPEAQRNIALFIPQFVESVKRIISLKGMVINGMPLMILGVIGICAVASNLIKSSDILVFIGLTVITLMVNIHYNVGRVVMYSFPFYLPAASIYISSYFNTA